MHTLTFSEARSNLKDVLDRVENDADVTIITRRGADAAVIMSLDTFNSWRETLYLLSSPTNARHIAKSIAELDAGKGRARTLIDPSVETQVRDPRVRHAAKKTGKPPAKPGKRRG